MHSVTPFRGVLCHARHLFARLAERRAAAPLRASYGRVVVDLGLDRITHQLAPAERETLALAFYLDDTLARIGADNYAAPALLLGSLLEQVLRGRVLARVELLGKHVHPRAHSLGTLPTIRKAGTRPLACNESAARVEARENWRRLLYWASASWDEDVIPFEHFVCSLWRTAELRNQAAHGMLSVEQYSTLERRVCGAEGRPGALAQLVSATGGQLC